MCAIFDLETMDQMEFFQPLVLRIYNHMSNSMFFFLQGPNQGYCEPKERNNYQTFLEQFPQGKGVEKGYKRTVSVKLRLSFCDWSDNSDSQVAISSTSQLFIKFPV